MNDFCVWIWMWTNLKRTRGIWFPDPVAVLLGKVCKEGRCLNPIDVGFEGEKEFQRCLMQCKPSKGNATTRCADLTCKFKYINGNLIPDGDNCPSGGSNCKCPKTHGIKKVLKRLAMFTPNSTEVVLFCMTKARANNKGKKSLAVGR